jgi:subtilase family serine protease
VQGCPAAKPPPPNNGTGQEARNLWLLEVALDVEWAHATAPLANILLVTTPTAETLGVQGLQQMMHAEQYVIDNHLADVITQSFGAGEGSFHIRLAALQQLRQSSRMPRPTTSRYCVERRWWDDQHVQGAGEEPHEHPVSERDLAGVGSARHLCGGANPCSTGWYVVGGTSAGSPHWAGLGAIADQMADHDLGFLNPKLYSIASNPAKYPADFYDVMVGCNQTSDIPCYCASPSWDAVTGLGTPDAARLIPDLIAAS